MPQVGIDYESNPAGFLAATREVMGASAEALKGFDLTDRGLKRLAVAYLSTGDVAKQASTIQRMTAMQTANDMAASSVRQVAAQREVQAVTRETALVQEQSARRSGAATQLISSFFKADTLRTFRGDAKEASLAGEGLGKTLGVLGGSIAITAAAAPLINRAFGALQKPAEMLDKAMFGAADEIRKTREEIGKLAASDLSGFSLSAAKSIADVNVALLALQQRNASAFNTAAALEYASAVKVVTGDSDALLQAYAASGGVINQQVEQAAKAADTLLKLGLGVSDADKKILASVQAYNTANDAAGVYNANVNALAHDLGTTYVGAQAAAAAAGYTLEGQTRAQIDAFAAEQIAANNTAAAIANLAASAAAAQTAIASLIAIGGDLPAPLAAARTHAAGAAAAASIAQTIATAGGLAQAQANEAAVYRVPKHRGGAGYTAAQASKDMASDQLTNLASRIQTEGQTSPSSIAYAEQIRKEEQRTLSLAEGYRKHAAAMVKAADGEKARHSATQTLARAQSEVNAATRNLVKLQHEETAIRAQEAKDALGLRNAKLEALSNMADASVAAAVKVTEAKSALDLEKKNTLAYYQDLTAYNAAVADQARQAADAAAQAKTAALDLANAQIEAGINYADPLSAAKAAVAEAQNRVNADTPGTAAYYSDDAALHQAMYGLTQAMAQNTASTNTNTSALTGVLPGGQEPGFIALRAANSSSFLNRPSASAQPLQVNLVVDGKTVASQIVTPMIQEINGVLTFNPRALLTPTG